VRAWSSHLQIPRGVLAERLKSLVAAGVLERVPGQGARSEYALTAKGRSLWPVIRAMTSWGDMHYAPAGPRRLFRHVADGGALDAGCRCSACGAVVEAGAAEVSPGPGLEAPGDEPVARALTRPHRLMEPLISGGVV
jgi:DNA-binding MarR family transcriptional regulator